MSNREVCPSAEDLRDYLHGHLADHSALEIESHVLTCEPCSFATLQLAKVGTCIQVLRPEGRKPSVNPSDGPASSEEAESADEVRAGAQRLKVLMSRLRSLPDDLSKVPFAQSAIQRDGLDSQLDWSSCFAPSQSTDEIGRLGKFRVLRLLGSGGMGAVFLAEDVHLGRQVALKVIQPDFVLKEGMTKRFLLEARAAAAVQNEHVVTIHEVGVENQIPFLAMEYLQGESLEERLEKGDGISIAEILRIGREISEGLAAAHSRGLIHRDIKPANIWLEARRDRVKLLDFGLARMKESDTRLSGTGMIVGTPAYMAPEQASGEEIGPQTDLFSLGVVLYRMATSQLPFLGRNTLDTLRLLATITPPSASTINTEVPAVLSELIDQLLSRQPVDRPATAASVVERISEIERQIQSSKPADTEAPFESNPNALKHVPPRKPRIALALLGAAVLALLGFIRIRIAHKNGTETEIKVADTDAVKIEIKPDSYKATAAIPTAAPPAQARTIPATKAISPTALVTRPAVLPGVKSWTLETVLPRDGFVTRLHTMAVSRDDQFLAIGGNDCVVRVYELPSLKLLSILPGHHASIHSVAWSPNSRILATSDGAGEVCFWDVRQGKKLFSRKEASPGVQELSWSPDGKRIAITSLQFTILDFESRKVVSPEKTFPAYHADWSPDGKTLAVSKDLSLDLVNPETCQITRTLYSKLGYDQFVYETAWSPDGRWLAVASDSLKAPELHEVSTGKKRTVELHQGFNAVNETQLAWSADGKWLWFGGSKEGLVGLIAWSMETGKLADGVSVVGQQRVACVAAFHQVNKYLIAGEMGGTLHLMNAATAKSELWKHLHGTNVAASLAPDGRGLAVSGGQVGDSDWFAGAFGYWNFSTGAFKNRRLTNANLPVWSADGRGFSVGNGHTEPVIVVSFDTGSEAQISQNAFVAALSPDRSLLAAASAPTLGKNIETLDLLTNSRRKLLDLKSSDWIHYVAWTPDAKLVVTVSGKLIRAARADTGKVAWEFETPTFVDTLIPVSVPTGEQRLLVYGYDQPCTLLDAASGSVIRQISSNILGVAMTPDGKTIRYLQRGGLVVETSVDQLDTRPLVKLPYAVQGSFSRDSRFVLTQLNRWGSAVSLWVADTGEPVATFCALRRGGVAISSDGHFAADKDAAEQMAYVVEFDDHYETLTHAEFATRFGWKNDPNLLISTLRQTQTRLADSNH